MRVHAGQWSRAVLLVCFGGLLLGCSSQDQHPADPGTPDANTATLIGCFNDKRADTYTANLVKSAASQKLKVTLISADPAPPARDNNHWTVKITDAAGAPITDPIAVTPRMPDHGHPSSVDPIVTPNGDGTYDISKLYFFMAGLWQVTFSTNEVPADSVAFSFCIEG